MTNSKVILLQAVVALVVVVVHHVACEQKSYAGYAVYRCNPQTEEQVNHLRDFMIANGVDEGIKFWTEPNHINGSVDIMLAPNKQVTVLRQLNVWNVPTHKRLADVGEAIQRTIVDFDGASRNVQVFANQSQLRQNTLGGGFYSRYQPYAQIEAKLSQLSQLPHVKVESVGRSYENRQIHLVKISTNPNANKPVIFIDALHHAREWVSASTAMYMIESLAGGSTKLLGGSSGRNGPRRGRQPSNRQARSATNLRQSMDNALNNFDFWIVPVLNPDGYEHSRVSDRLWRKTRSNHRGCKGADPNRNYPYHWNEAGTSSSPCSELYAGPSPLSEPETKLLVNLLDGNKNRLAMYITLHAFSQVILCPYGYARVYPSNYKELQRVAQVGIGEIATIRGTRYTFGTAAILLYPAAGGSDDYALGTTGVPYSYTIELPDKGHYGFLLPPSEIIPVGRETTAGIMAMTKAIQVNRRRG